MKQVFSFVLLLFTYLFLKAIFILKIPPIWRDESVFSAIAYNIINYHEIRLDLWGDSFIGSTQHYLAYPPIFFYLLSLWLKVWGFSIYAQRSLTILAGIAFFTIFYYFLKQTVKNLGINSSIKLGPVYFLVIFALVFDSTFFITTTASRPEIFVLITGILSLIFFQKAEMKNGIKKRDFFLKLSGALAGVTFLLHFIGIFFFLSEIAYLLVIYRSNFFKKRIFNFFMLYFFIPILLWIMSLIPNIELFIKQAELIFLSRTSGPNWYHMVLSSPSLELRTLYISYLVVSIFFLIYSLTSKNKKNLLFVILLLLSWILSYFGRIQPYAAFPLPIVYTCLTILVVESLTHRGRIFKFLFVKWIGGLLSITLIGLNFNFMYQNALSLGGDDYSYEYFSKKVLEIIPPGKTIYLATIPNLYYAFKERGDNKFYQYSEVPISREIYINSLNQVDYIVYNGPYEGPELSSVTKDYVSNNTSKFFYINEPFQYGAIVIELKPRDQRK